MKPLLSIIIVNYHVPEELIHCITSIKEAHTKTPYEIIVVDNDEKKSIDKILKKKFPSVQYIANSKNNGYGAGNNLGATYAKGKYLYILNPDTIVKPHAIDLLVSYVEKYPETAIAAPLILDPEEKPHLLQGTQALTPWRAAWSFSFLQKLFPHNSIYNEYWTQKWDKKHIQQVYAVPGTAFVIRKDIFDSIGGFDEKFFLYFEETDLCKRVKDAGYSIVMIPDAKIIHFWGKSTQKSEKNISAIFQISRAYYFKKHFGLLQSFLIEAFLRINKTTCLVGAILVLGIFLRLYKLSENFYFDGEIGDNLLDIKNAFVHGYLPFLGPPTSHPWLYFGPLFYWIYGPILALSKFNPISYGYFGAIVSILTLYVNYLTTKKIFSQAVAVLSTFLIAISPIYLEFSRNARFFSLDLLLIYPFLWVCYTIAQKKNRSFFLLGVLFGLLLNFHYSPLMLIPFVISLFVIRKVRVSFKDIEKMLLGIATPLLPLLIYDGQHGFRMMGNLILWIPYRIAGFFGLYHKNTISAQVLHENAVSFSDFLTGHLFIHATNVIVILCIVLFGLYSIKRLTRKRDFSFIFLLLWGLWGFVAVFIHGSPPIHYFTPILAFPIILVSYLLTDVWNYRYIGKVLVLITLVGISIPIGMFLFSSQWFYRYKVDPFPYADRLTTAKTIITTAKGKPFTFTRVGYYDKFAKQYAQNYLYLLWWLGNEPTTHASLHYTVYEQSPKVPKKLQANQAIFHINPNIVIIRQEE